MSIFVNLFQQTGSSGTGSGSGTGRGKRKSAIAAAAAMVDTDMPMLSAEDKEKPYACNSKYTMCIRVMLKHLLRFVFANQCKQLL